MFDAVAFALALYVAGLVTGIAIGVPIGFVLRESLHGLARLWVRRHGAS